MRSAYGLPRHFNPIDPLDDLIFLVLSRMTQEIKYVRTYSRLRDSLSEWSAVRDAPPDRSPDYESGHICRHLFYG